MPCAAYSFLFPAFLFVFDFWFIVLWVVLTFFFFLNDCCQICCCFPLCFVLFFFPRGKSCLLPDQMKTHLYSRLVLRGTFVDLAPFYFLDFSLPASEPQPLLLRVTPPFFSRGQSSQLGRGFKDANEGKPSPASTPAPLSAFEEGQLAVDRPHWRSVSRLLTSFFAAGEEREEKKSGNEPQVPGSYLAGPASPVYIFHLFLSYCIFRYAQLQKLPLMQSPRASQRPGPSRVMRPAAGAPQQPPGQGSCVFAREPGPRLPWERER